MERVGKSGVFVLLAHGFEETDVSTVTRALRRSGISVSVVGLTAGPLRGAYGLALAPDCTLSEVEMERPLAVVLPGGVQATRQFNGDPRVHILLRRVAGQGGYVMVLDTAYTVARRAGVLERYGPRSNGGYGGEAAERPIPGWGDEMAVISTVDELPSERVLVDGQMVFGRDSGSAQEAALALASLLGESRYRARRGNHARGGSWGDKKR